MDRHSTLLIEIDGLRILTDPVWAVVLLCFVCGPNVFSPRHYHFLLCRIGCNYYSHDHYDHLDTQTIKKLADRIFLLLFPGVGQHLQKWGSEKRILLKWIGEIGLHQEQALYATPARHFSGKKYDQPQPDIMVLFRYENDRHNIFFGADSGWFTGFETIVIFLAPLTWHAQIGL